MIPRLALPALAALACLAPLPACHLIIDLDDDDDVSSIDAPTTDAPVDSLVGDGDCNAPLPCPTPNAGSLTVCGQLWDLEDEEKIASMDDVAQCGPPTSSGPCSISVRYYDALDFAQNPDTAQEINAGSTYLDSCGRFRAVDLPTPTFGFLGIVTDDAAGTPEVRRRTVITVAAGLAQPANNLRAYVTRITTDEAWSAASGLPPPLLSQRGIYVPIYLHHGAPVAGVRVTRDNNQIPNDDLYFSDPAATRSTVDPSLGATGPNGSAIVINAPTPIQYAGSGGAPAGCEWPQTLAAAIPGAIMVQRKHTEQPGGAPCP